MNLDENIQRIQNELDKHLTKTLSLKLIESYEQLIEHFKVLQNLETLPHAKTYEELMFKSGFASGRKQGYDEVIRLFEMIIEETKKLTVDN